MQNGKKYLYGGNWNKNHKNPDDVYDEIEETSMKQNEKEKENKKEDVKDGNGEMKKGEMKNRSIEKTRAKVMKKEGSDKQSSDKQTVISKAMIFLKSSGRNGWMQIVLKGMIC